ncbi:MAG: HAMP domain-containing protein [Acidimicrobiales bacterium]|nr:HAMP domain-containing protein [Acidimicrobiales bacterium]MYG88958.1 HAMP domain-containing protein [Acidimicrobiales bacterium]MYI28624.1 HAMP domain-containing protein [Acidimicrobiales bacterium]
MTDTASAEAPLPDGGGNTPGTSRAREHRKPAIHLRISTQMYAGIAVPLLLTLAASVVAWISFTRVGEAEQQVTQGAIPELDAALGVAEASNRLVAGGPRLTSAERDDYEAVVAEIAAARREFEAQLDLLWNRGAGSMWLGEMRSDAARLSSNIDAIEAEMPEYYALLARAQTVQADADAAVSELTSQIVPALDDQLFFLVQGRRQMWTPPAPESIHRSESEVLTYRRWSALSGDVSQADALLASAFSASESALIEPLRESFESARDRIEINLAALDEPAADELRPTVSRLIELGLGDGGVFDVIFRTLQIAENQRALLAQNQALGVGMVNEIESLVGAVQTSVDAATAASARAVSTGRVLLVVISIAGVVGALAFSWLFVGRRILRRVAGLSDRMRTLAGGDLETPVETGGRDEVAEMANALEQFRQAALEVQRLNLVEELAGQLSERNAQLSQTLADLDRAQDQIVANEKLAALGEVTAGVAHEIRNPLNFVKNFAESSGELLDELLEAVADPAPADDQADYIAEITGDLKENLTRIRGHGDRANRIVESMLMMGRGGGESRPVEINALLEEHAMLSYHSARAQDADFNVTIERDFDPELGELEVIPQDMGRVFLNLVSNAGYAANKRWRDLGGEAGKMVGLDGGGGEPYFPTIWLSTRRTDESAVIAVRDNGTGIPPDVVQRIFEPFFTTKPTNEGTGLGLAMSNDIVRGHGGQITVESEPGEYTEFTVELPLERAAPVEPIEPVQADDAATPAN